MTHEQLMTLMGHDSDIRFTLLVQRDFGLPLEAVPHAMPAEQYALDTALLEGQHHAVPEVSAAFLDAFEKRLDHRLALETAAADGGAYALHRLNVAG